MPIYKVTSPLSHNGVIYQAGQHVKLTTQEAESLLELKYPPIKKDPIPLESEEVTEEVETEIGSISEKTVVEVRNLISGTTDLKQLEAWLKEEETRSNRRTVISLLTNRISQLTEEGS